jgi:hypothetical protein
MRIVGRGSNALCPYSGPESGVGSARSMLAFESVNWNPQQVPPKGARDTGQVLVRYENSTGCIYIITFGVKKEFSDEMVSLWA